MNVHAFAVTLPSYKCIVRGLENASRDSSNWPVKMGMIVSCANTKLQQSFIICVVVDLAHCNYYIQTTTIESDYFSRTMGHYSQRAFFLTLCCNLLISDCKLFFHVTHYTSVINFPVNIACSLRRVFTKMFLL